MAYCTQDDLLKQIPELELAELTAERGSIPDAFPVAEAIAKADSEINSYLAMRYEVPVSPVPVRLRSLSEDIAIYYLYVRRSVVPEPREKNYRRAIEFLKMVAAGQAVLLHDNGREVSSVNSGAGPGVQFTSAMPVFDRESMSGF